MPLTADEQQELDKLEYDKLLSEKDSAQAPAVSPNTSAQPSTASSPEVDLKAEWQKAGPLERLMILVNRFPQQYVKTNTEVANKVLDMGIEAGGPAAGQAIGAMTGPAAPVMVPTLGAVGGMVGDAVVQARGDQPFSAGRMVGAAIQGAIPGANLAGAEARTVAREAGKYAAGSLAAKTAETEIDRGELPTMQEGAMAAGTAALGAQAAKILSKVPARTEGELMYAARDSALKSLRNEGVVVPPHEIARGSDMLSSIAGKSALSQEAAKRNQFVWQRLAREQVGLSKKALPISVSELNVVRDAAGEPYRQIQKISEDAQNQLDEIGKTMLSSDPHDLAVTLNSPQTKAVLDPLVLQAGAQVEALKKARVAAQRAYDSFKAGNPAGYEQWQAQKELADNLEQQIEKAASSVGDGSLLKRLQTSRKKIAQTYSIEDALNPSTGLVDPKSFGRQLVNGEPLTDNLKKIADFQLAFNREAVESTRVPTPGVNNIGTMNAMQMASRGNAPGVIGAVVGSTIGRPARAYLLSDVMQNNMLSPSERQNFSAAFARYLAENHPDSRRRAQTQDDDSN